jgi:hypothetical protein
MELIHPDLLELKDPDDLLEDQHTRKIPARYRQLVEERPRRGTKHLRSEWE